MARFVVGKPVTTREPFIEVDAGLGAGIHRFQLEVVTDDGRVSKPDVVAVVVVERIVNPVVIRDVVRDVRGVIPE